MPFLVFICDQSRGWHVTLLPNSTTLQQSPLSPKYFSLQVKTLESFCENPKLQLGESVTVRPPSGHYCHQYVTDIDDKAWLPACCPLIPTATTHAPWISDMKDSRALLQGDAEDSSSPHWWFAFLVSSVTCPL